MKPLIIKIITQDNVNIHAEIIGENNSTVLIINSAIGMKRKVYYAFAEYLAENGVTVLLYNYRGMEDGLNDLPNDAACDVEAWGRLDQSAVIDWIESELNPTKLFVLGHSIGGQLLGFAENIDKIDGLIHIAAQKGDKRFWSMVGFVKLYLLWHILIPWMSKGKMFNAKKLGLGSYPWPAAAAKQWSSWGQQKDYLFNPKFGFDLSPWHNFNKPILSIGFTDDDMAPEAAIDGLLKEFGKNLKPETCNQLIQKRIINPKSLGLDAIGHFGFFKPKTKALWSEIISWLKKSN